MLKLNFTTIKGFKKSGFTLVEVIVVSVIVAVLSLSAAMIYRDYVQESQQNVANNLATSAARFLQTAINLDTDVSTFLDLDGNSPIKTWNINFLSGGQSSFTCPKNVLITLDRANKNVSVSYKGKTSVSKYDQ